MAIVYSLFPYLQLDKIKRDLIDRIFIYKCYFYFRITYSYLSPFCNSRFLFLGTSCGIINIFDTLKRRVSSYTLYPSDFDQNLQNVNMDVIGMELDPNDNCIYFNLWSDNLGLMLVNYANGTMNLYNLKNKLSQLNFKFNEQVTCLSFDPSDSGLFCLGFNDGTIGFFNKNQTDPINIIFGIFLI